MASWPEVDHVRRLMFGQSGAPRGFRFGQFRATFPHRLDHHGNLKDHDTPSCLTGRFRPALLWIAGILFPLEELDIELGPCSEVVQERVSQEDGYGSGQGVFAQEWDTPTPTAKGITIHALPLSG